MAPKFSSFKKETHLQVKYSIRLISEFTNIFPFPKYQYLKRKCKRTCETETDNL